VDGKVKSIMEHGLQIMQGVIAFFCLILF